MDNIIDLTPLFRVIFILICTLISAYLIPYLKKKLGAQKLENAYMWIEKAVKAAEVLFPESKSGPSKLLFVKDFLKGKGFDFDEKELEVLINSEVLKLWNTK